MSLVPISLQISLFVSIFLICMYFEAFKSYLDAETHGLSYSMHIDELLITFVFAANQRLYSPVFGLVHGTVLSIITYAWVIKIGRFMDVDLTELVYEESLLRCE